MVCCLKRKDWIGKDSMVQERDMNRGGRYDLGKKVRLGKKALVWEECMVLEERYDFGRKLWFVV